MSKKPQVLKDVPSENAGINSVDNSSINFISQCRLFKMRDFKVGLERLKLPLIELSNKSGNQVYIHALSRVAKFKNINYSILSLSYNIGLVFVFIVYNALNTPILSL